MIYSINNIAKLYSNIYVFNSLHQTQKYNSMKRNPKKNKRDNNDAFSYETKKIKKHTFNGQWFCHYSMFWFRQRQHCSRSREEPLTMNERVTSEKPLVSARMEGMRPIYSTKKIQQLICINFLPKQIES